MEAMLFSVLESLKQVHKNSQKLTSLLFCYSNSYTLTTPKTVATTGMQLPIEPQQSLDVVDIRLKGLADLGIGHSHHHQKEPQGAHAAHDQEEQPAKAIGAQEDVKAVLHEGGEDQQDKGNQHPLEDNVLGVCPHLGLVGTHPLCNALEMVDVGLCVGTKWTRTW